MGCPGPAWVSVPLTAPFRTTAGAAYVVSVDNLDFFVKSSFTLNVNRTSGGLMALQNGAVYGWWNGMPTVGGWGPHNYWVDGTRTISNTYLDASGGSGADSGPSCCGHRCC